MAGKPLTIELRLEVARALLAAEPFDRTDSSDWIEGRDVLMNAIANQGGDDGR